MRRVILLLAPMALGVVLSMAAVLLTGAYTDSVLPAEAQTASTKPNFVFILTDDLDARLLQDHLEDYPTFGGWRPMAPPSIMPS